MASYHLYTDASYLPRLSRGGWAWVMVEDTPAGLRYMAKGNGKVVTGPDLDHGIWSLEIRAILEAAQWVTRAATLTVSCDNHTVVEVINGHAQDDTLARYRDLPVLIKLEQAVLERELRLVARYVLRNSDIYAAYADHVAGAVARSRKIFDFTKFEYGWTHS